MNKTKQNEKSLSVIVLTHISPETRRTVRKGVKKPNVINLFLYSKIYVTYVKQNAPLFLSVVNYSESRTRFPLFLLVVTDKSYYEPP